MKQEINKEFVEMANSLIKSVNCGLTKVNNGSLVEYEYLNEKITKLKRLLEINKDNLRRF